MIDPRFLTVTQWTDAVNLTLATLAPVPVLKGVEGWKEWAYVIVSAPAIAKFSPPLPDRFSDWREWAERFVEAVPL